jgi:ABC-type transporter Mla subunit MlaD
MTIFRPEIRTGLLVIVSLVVLVGVLLYLGAPGVFVKQNTHWIYVQNAAGLKQGGDVALAGRKVGQVVQMFSPVPLAERPKGFEDREVLIEIRVDRSARIYKDVKVMLTQNGLLGEMFIDFTGGVESNGLAPNGSRFLGERPPGLDQAVPTVIEKIDPALKQITETLQTLRATAENVNKLTAEHGEVQVMLGQFREVGGNLNSLTASNGPLRQSLDNIERLTSDEGKLGQALSNIKDLTDPDSSLAKTMKNAEKFTADLSSNKDINLTLRNFRAGSEKLNRTMDDLSGQFSAIAGNLEQATDTVKRQPWRLIWPSTKKYPEENASPGVTHTASPRRAPAREKSRGRSGKDQQSSR